MNKRLRHIAVISVCAYLLIVSCSERTANTAPTIILSNGHIWTGKDSLDFVEAIAITGNKITQIGTTRSIGALAGPNTKIIDLQGNLVTAGFNDAHIHFLKGSLGLTQVELSKAQSLDDMITITQKFVQDFPDKDWITGRGWQYTFFETGLPDHNSLKFLDIDKPVFIKAYDGHSAYANKKALDVAGITSTTEFNGFGEVVKDKSGEPTGTLKESAMSLVERFVPSPSEADQLSALREGLELAASLGITSIQDANGDESNLKLFIKLLQENELTIRYAAAFSVNENTTVEDIDRFSFLKDSIGFTNPHIRADAIKLMIDGVIESHSACMLKPYADLPSNSKDVLGSLTMPVSRYQQLVNAVDQKGFRIYTHAIGDSAVRVALDTYESISDKNNPNERRNRVEHIETISPDDIGRFTKLNVMASMEPNHAQPGPGEGVWEKAVGPKRLPYSFAWNSLLQSGARLLYSSDWPAAFSVDPIRGLHVAVTRTNPSGYPDGGWVPEQRISLSQALKAYTFEGAYSSFEEGKKGLIAPGYLADVIVYSDDLFQINPLEINNTRVLLTIFDGKVIFNEMP